MSCSKVAFPLSSAELAIAWTTGGTGAKMRDSTPIPSNPMVATSADGRPDVFISRSYGDVRRCEVEERKVVTARRQGTPAERMSKDPYRYSTGKGGKAPYVISILN